MLSEQLEAQSCREEVLGTLLQSSRAQVDGHNADGVRSALWGGPGTHKRPDVGSIQNADAWVTPSFSQW